MAGYYSMNKKSACIDFRTNLENSLEGHNQLVDSNERLIFFQCNLCETEFSSSDKLIEIRKKRHEEWHDPKINLKSKNRILNKTGEKIWI